MASIPIDRPVLGGDLEKLRISLGLTVDDARWLFGVSMNRWGTIVQSGFNDIVPNASIALLARYYDMKPETCPVPARPEAQDVVDATDSNLKRLGIYLGKEHVSGFRWIKRGGSMSPTVSRLAKHLIQEANEGNLDWWVENLVEAEAKARGLPDVMKVGAWKTEAAKKAERKKRDSSNEEKATKADDDGLSIEMDL